MSQHLFLCQIGPVQSFIATARRTQDLYVGSRLLSILASAGVEAALKKEVQLIFPATDTNGSLPKGVPHRFAFISNLPPHELGEDIEQAIRSQWRDIAGMVKDWLYDQVGDGEWEAVFDGQVETWLEFYWVAVPYNKSQHGQSYEHANRVMAARKQSRTFSQIDEPGVKCTLTGAMAALPLDWKQLRYQVGEKTLRPNEKLGALAIIKRFLQVAANDADFWDEVEHFPDTTTIAGGIEGDGIPHYLAVLHMDGDRMGARLSKITTIKEHQSISSALAEFAQSDVPRIIREQINENRYGRRGEDTLIYAGGDDVLALLPLWAVIPVADAIRQAFKERIGGTMSAGIAITPHDHPFDSALEESRHAEKQAKNRYGRNSIVIRQNTGQIREAGAKWNLLGLIKDVQICFENDYLSGKLGYDLLNLAHELISDTGTSGLSPEAISFEARRLLKRRTAENVPEKTKKSIADLAEVFHELANPSETKADEQVSWESLATWVILARFLAKGAAAK